MLGDFEVDTRSNKIVNVCFVPESKREAKKLRKMLKKISNRYPIDDRFLSTTKFTCEE